MGRDSFWRTHDWVLRIYDWAERLGLPGWLIAGLLTAMSGGADGLQS
jgi:hypothetical protein